MILTFLLPLFVWHVSCMATDLLESCLVTDPLVKVAAMGVPVIVTALLMSGIVVVAFLATMSMALFFIVVLPFFDTPDCNIVVVALATSVYLLLLSLLLSLSSSLGFGSNQWLSFQTDSLKSGCPTHDNSKVLQHTEPFHPQFQPPFRLFPRLFLFLLFSLPIMRCDTHSTHC